MKIRFKVLFLALLSGVLNQTSAQEPQKQTIQQVPFNKVHFTDQFWLPRIEINRTVSIQSAFG